MVEKISFFKIFTYKALNSIRNKKYFSCFNIPKLKTLKKDIFISETKPAAIKSSQSIIIGNYNHKIKDDRFVHFRTDFYAYNYEGQGNIFPDSYICFDTKGERRLKPHVYINMAEVKPEYARQGVYTSAIKKLIETVKKDTECEGRIVLEARKIESPIITQIPSPSLAHWKCGFRFANEENNQNMKKVLNGELPPEQAPEGTMFYPLS